VFTRTQLITLNTKGRTDLIHTFFDSLNAERAYEPSGCGQSRAKGPQVRLLVV